MKKIFYSFACLAAAAFASGLSSCQNEDIANTVTEESESLEVVATGSFNIDTRTSFPVTENSVTFNWSADDKIVVLSENGDRNLGVLTLKQGDEGKSTGDFTGSLRTRTSDTKVNIFYLGQNKTEGLNTISYDDNFNIADQLTAHKNLTDYGIMHATANLQRDASGKAVFQFKVSSLMTYAHYLFHLPAGVNATNEVIRVDGANVNNQFTLNFADASMTDVKAGSIAITPEWNGEEGSAYMVFVPANGIAPEFSLTIGEKTYKATLPTTEYEPNDFICGGNPAHGKDIYFSEDGSWTLTYMDGEDVFYTDNAQNFGPSYTFTVTDQKPTKTAHVFVGWAESADGEVVYYANDNLILNRPNTEKTLYAIYNPDPTGTSSDMGGFDPTSN